jgi:hypothetical protein
MPYEDRDKAIKLMKKIYSFDNDFNIKEELDFVLWYWEDKEMTFSIEHSENFLNKMKENLKEKEEQLKELENYINNIKKEWK